MDIWQIAYHLCGVTILGRTEYELLGALPIPIRSIVVEVANEIAPDLVEIDIAEDSLTFLDGVCRRVRQWQFTNPQLAEYMADNQQITYTHFTSTWEFFEYYNLLPQPDGKDEHYAERRFIEDVFVPILGLQGLSRLQPQQTFTGSDGKRRRIDFVLKGSKAYAIEIEGETYHRVDGKFIDETQRTRDLAICGYTYIPFAYEAIDTDKEHSQQALRNMIEQDNVLHLLLNKESNDVLPKLFEIEFLTKAFSEQYQQYQKLVLTLLWNAHKEGKKNLVLGDSNQNLPLFYFAVFDTIDLLKCVAKLYEVPLLLPKIKFYIIGQTGKLYNNLLNKYQQYTSNIAYPDNINTSISVLFAKFKDVPTNICFDFLVDSNSFSTSPLNKVRSIEKVAGYITPFLTHSATRLPSNLQVKNFDRSLIDYFARRYFTVPELKSEQFMLLHRTLRGESVLGILPTGFGKSLIFQLYAILALRTTLVISPLKALIRDQSFSLKKLGWRCVAGMTGDLTSAEKADILQGFREHCYRILYISPERLQIKDFYAKLKEVIAESPLSALVIDEAHCISEWGHDFRPAYLQIGRVRRILEAEAGYALPIIALTATASSIVRKDIITVTGLAPENVIQLANADRPNLSLSVHPIADIENAKRPMLKSLLEYEIPKALRIPFTELIPQQEYTTYFHAGIVFAIYANSSSRYSFPEGVHSIADFLVEHVTYDKKLVGVHASQAPKICPVCGSPLLQKVAQQLRCQKCKNSFDENNTKLSENWDEQIIQQQNDFQNKLFPILVATKGYGMGIDKRNVRYIIHHALSGGFEGYYQEAGRAGRDGQHSHIALIYKPPTNDCYNSYLKHHAIPPCQTGDNKFTCPYGLKGLCDAGRQAYFIQLHYPGIKKDLDYSIEVHKKISNNKKLISKIDADSELQSNQITLYRLQQLGVVHGYTLEFKSNKVIIEVDYNDGWQVESVVQNLKNFLLKTSAVNEIETEKLLVPLYSNILILSNSITQKQYVLKKALEILLQRIYEVIPAMRYTMLGNLLRYAKSHERNVCRRVEIKSMFDLETIPLNDYRCGFCDVCCPDLIFEQKQAEVPLHDVQVDDVARRLSIILENFKIDELSYVVQIAIEKEAVFGFYVKANHVLEREPTNLAALYLAGALALQQKEFTELGLKNLHTAYKEAERRGYNRESLIFIYRTACNYAAETALTWLVEPGGAFDFPEGLEFLVHEAKEIFGENSLEYTNIQHLRKIRIWRKLQPEIMSIVESIHRLAPELMPIQKMDKAISVPTPLERIWPQTQRLEEKVNGKTLEER